jgi:DNA-binding IclR family transcriptional regulator
VAKNETRRLLHPILRYAAKTTGLTIYFAWADYPDIVYLDKVEGEKGRPNSSDPGQRIPMHLAASGRAILAFLGKEQIEAAIRNSIATAGTDGPEPPDLRTELETIRHRHYAVSERSSARINSIAAPVWNSSPTPVGSIVLTSDSVTLPRTDFDHIGALATSIGEQATTVLGGKFPIVELEAP